MPQVKCPRCGRSIGLDDSELALLIECAGCDTRFYPMMPVDGPLPSHPARGKTAAGAAPGRVAVPPGSGGSVRPARAPGGGPDPAPPPSEPPPAAPKPKERRPRKRKKRVSWVPAVVAVSLAIIVVSFNAALVLIIRSNVFSRPPATAPGGGGGRPVPAPAGGPVGPAAPHSESGDR